MGGLPFLNRERRSGWQVGVRAWRGEGAGREEGGENMTGLGLQSNELTFSWRLRVSEKAHLWPLQFASGTSSLCCYWEDTKALRAWAYWGRLCHWEYALDIDCRTLTLSFPFCFHLQPRDGQLDYTSHSCRGVLPTSYHQRRKVTGLLGKGWKHPNCEPTVLKTHLTHLLQWQLVNSMTVLMVPVQSLQVTQKGYQREPPCY